MLKLRGESKGDNQDIYSLKISLPKMLIKFTGKNSYFTVKKPGSYHLNQVIKLSSQAIRCINIMYPLK